VISDIHGNLEALEEALRDIDARGVDEIVCVGDVIGYGADPAACLRLVRDRCRRVLLGNHDEAAFNPRITQSFNSYARRAADWTRGQLEDGDRDFLRGLPYTLSLDGEQLLFAHGTPRSPQDFDYIFGDMEARSYADAFTGRLCFVGHTHIPRIHPLDARVRGYTPSDRFIINCGSVGQPRDRDSRLSYGLLDTVAGTYENVRLAYDVAAAAAKIVDAGLPAILAQRLAEGR
jgi:diadenosine tetraphosphatase ApaH/serine/threonine PP2A family protein phosphatase